MWIAPNDGLWQAAASNVTASQQSANADYQRASKQPRREHKQRAIISAEVAVMCTDQHSCEHHAVSRRFFVLHVMSCHLVTTHRHGVASQQTSIFINLAVRNAGSAGNICLQRVQKTAKPVHSSVMVIIRVCQFYFSSVSQPHRRRQRGEKNTMAYFKGEREELVEKGSVSAV